MASGTDNSSRLDSVYGILEKLNANSSDADFDAVGSYFAPGAAAYLWSMRDAPAIGPAGISDALKELHTESRLVERRVVSRTIADGGSKVVFEMNNLLEVFGKPLEQPETVIATFDGQGLINDFKIYTCRSHFVMIKQRATGEGPYRHELVAAGGDNCP